MKDMVAILMSTYNGEKFLKEQIESILKQTHKNWTLYIRDDGSSDGSQAIIKDYIKDNERIIFLNSKKNLGVVKSFLCLLSSVKADYYMFCDQDDVWLEDKVLNALKLIKYREEKGIKPILVHTDLKVVDQDLNLRASSMFEYQDIPQYQKNYLSAFIQNNVTGCTMIINNHLKNLVAESDKILMHDWWFSLIGLSFGEVCFSKQADILYRQHENNVVGAQNANTFNHISKRLKKLFDLISGKESQGGSGVRNLFLQAQSFNNIYGDRLDENRKEELNRFLMLLKMSKIERLFFLMKNKITYGRCLMKLDINLAIIFM